MKLFLPWVENNWKALQWTWDNKENGEQGGRKSEKEQELGFKEPRFTDLTYGFNHLSKR